MPNNIKKEHINLFLEDVMNGITLNPDFIFYLMKMKLKYIIVLWRNFSILLQTKKCFLIMKQYINHFITHYI